MADIKSVLEYLQRAGLSADEAVIYLALLDGASTHLRLSRITGITRSKVYRVVDMLQRRGLVAHHADDTGRSIVAADPENLEIQLRAEDGRIQEQLEAVRLLVPELARLNRARHSGQFTVRTYEGLDGLRQMLWHELKTKGEMVVLGGARLESLAPNARWAERHRDMTVAAGYHIRVIQNEAYSAAPPASPDSYKRILTARYLDRQVLVLDHQQIAIYNSTVAIYHWRTDQKMGVEIINAVYATTMRQIFEQYWQLADDHPMDNTEAP